MRTKYWNETIECMSTADRKRLEAERLQAQIQYNCGTSAYFQSKVSDARIRPSQIKSTDDLPLLPLTEKAEISDSQYRGEFLGINQCASLEDIVRIQATGGTTGRPMRIGFTRQDIDDYCEMGARALWAMGCRPTDVVFTCMNFSLYAGGLSDHLIFERLGATTIPYSVGQSERLLAMMVDIKRDISLWSTPSYAVRLAEVCDTIELDRSSVGLSKGYFSGEPGIQVPGYRERIENLWGMTAQDLYGTGELGLHSGECGYRQGFHYGAIGLVFTELINPDTTEPLSFTDGQVGEAVYTSLRRQAMPLQRMRSHDLMQVFTEPCKCGRTSFRFKMIGRSDDMFIVKGVNVFPQAIQATLFKLVPRLTGEFQVLLHTPPPIDTPVDINVEVARDVPVNSHESLRTEIRTRIQGDHNISCTVTLVQQGTIATEKKTPRLIRTYLAKDKP